MLKQTGNRSRRSISARSASKLWRGRATIVPRPSRSLPPGPPGHGNRPGTLSTCNSWATRSRCSASSSPSCPTSDSTAGSRWRIWSPASPPGGTGYAAGSDGCWAARRRSPSAWAPPGRCWLSAQRPHGLEPDAARRRHRGARRQAGARPRLAHGQRRRDARPRPAASARAHPTACRRVSPSWISSGRSATR